MAKKMNRCVIICASPFNQPNFIKNFIRDDDFIICADGGYDITLKIGIKPNIIIGDFDSLSVKENISTKKIILPVEKDDTDSIFCIKYAIKLGYKEFAILGATGGRSDHLYSNLFLLKYLYKKNCIGVIADKYNNIYYTENNLELKSKNRTVSILPFGCQSACVTLIGFKYKADNLIMTSHFPIGISNIANSDISYIKVHDGGVIVFENLF